MNETTDTEEEMVSVELQFSADCPMSLLGDWLHRYEKLLDAAVLLKTHNRKKKRVLKKQQNRLLRAQRIWDRIHRKIEPYVSVVGIPVESGSSLSSEDYDSCIKNPSKDV